MAKNSARTGRPVSSVRSGGKKRRVSSKLINARRTHGAIQRFVAPGTAFGSMTTTGTPRASAASTGGPATYPPMLNTAAGFQTPKQRHCARVSIISRYMLFNLVSTPRFFTPPTRIFANWEPRCGYQACFHATLGSDKLRGMSEPRDLTRHCNRRNDVTACTSSSHNKGHPACSETFIKIPSETSVTSNELPPKLIMGRGNPLVGKIPSTTLMLKNACTTRSVVIPSAR